jgi:hypothetical protein
MLATECDVDMNFYTYFMKIVILLHLHVITIS